jgi:hypothetical protein
LIAVALLFPNSSGNFAKFAAIRRASSSVSSLADRARGEVLNLLEIWRGASFADVNQQTGFGEPGKGAPHGDKATCFASHA